MKGQSLLLLSLFCGVIHCQDACERITSSDLGSTGTASNTGLISEVLAPGGDSSTQPDVTLMDMTIVCEAQHMMEDRYRYTSVVVTYTCSSTDVQLPDCDGSTVFTEQFDFGCNGGSWDPSILGSSQFVRTETPTATLNTELDTDCRICINPDHDLAPPGTTSDTHCFQCTNCSVGLQRCYFDASSEQVCCSYFNQGSCVNTCPSPLVPDATSNQCGCSELMDANGNFSYTSNFLVGSMATLTCSNGFEISGTSPVTCQNDGWTGMPTCDPVCNQFMDNCTTCEVNGQDVTCTACQDGLVLMNGACTSPTTGAGCDVGCIIGIVVGILVLLIILILIIVLIVCYTCCRDNGVGSKTV